jgi:hypothetical protein
VYELHEGLNGSGNTVYLVVRVNAAGDWLFIHRFSAKEAAFNWMKYGG